MKRISIIVLLALSLFTASAQPTAVPITPAPQHFEQQNGSFKIADAKYVK
jgi:hypothetical protein